VAMKMASIVVCIVGVESVVCAAAHSDYTAADVEIGGVVVVADVAAVRTDIDFLSSAVGLRNRDH